MRRRSMLWSWITAIAAGMVILAVEASAQANCSNEPLAVQVLGSGGPDAGGTRASSGYLVWRAGQAVVMVDAGGGICAGGAGIAARRASNDLTPGQAVSVKDRYVRGRVGSP